MDDRGSSHVMREWQPHITLRSLEFNTTPYWVRVEGLTLSTMTRANVIDVGSLFFGLLEVDPTMDNGRE